MKKGKDAVTPLHIWPVFSALMVAGIDGSTEADAKAKLDRLVDRGVLARWEQWGAGLPDVYYLAGRSY